MRATPLLLAAAVLAAPAARADEPVLQDGAAKGQAAPPPPSALSLPPAPAPHDHPSLLDRSHTVAELETGIIALPSAPISPANRGGATPLGTIGSGDATVEIGVHLLYRATHEWAFGAGALLAPRPTSDSEYGGASGLARTHQRSYLFLGGELRYFPLRSRWVEGWFGVTGGAAIIGDRFAWNSAAQVPSFLGNNEVTVSTEGFGVGAQAGADYLINDRLVLGLTLRLEEWVLPTQKAFTSSSSCDPIGDCPTLTGSVDVFTVGITFGYRIPL